MFNIIVIIVLVTFIIGIAMFCYYLIYAHNINKKIQSGQVNHKKMIDIPKAMMIAIIILLLSYSVILSVGLKQSYDVTTTTNRNNFSIIDLSDYTFCGYSGTRVNDDASYTKVYSKKENKGYDKSVVKDGDFIFTLFTRNTNYDDFHPDYLCYVDYIGKMKSDFVRYEMCEYVNITSPQSKGSIMNGGGNLKRSLLYIGNLNEGESFKITECVFDEKTETKFSKANEKAYKNDKGEFPSIKKYALSSGSATITIK